MRTALFLVASLLLIVAFFTLAKLFAENFASATQWATIAFIALWFVITAFNMWIGVSKAGYSVSDELPIFLMLFAIPTALAIVIKWKFL